MSEINVKSRLNQKTKKPVTSSVPLPMWLLRLRKPLIILAHIITFAASLMLSFLVVHKMRFERPGWVDIYPTLLLFFLVVKLTVFWFFKQYKGWWRYVGISDLREIFRASVISTFIIVSLWFILGSIDAIRINLPADIKRPAEGVCIADMFATILMLGGLRIAIRLYFEEFRTIETGPLKRYLIVGAGDEGESLLRDFQKKGQYLVVGFVDDNPAKQGTFINGIPILGPVKQLPIICKKNNIEAIAIALPSASRRERMRIVRLCEGIKIKFYTVPSITDIAAGKLRVSQIREVDINDLLGRETVQLDLDLIENFAKDKTILVTGAGGSIGSEICKQLCNFNPKLILLIEQAENPLFYIERELSSKFPSIASKAIICDITDKARANEIFENYKPEVVIHAAAHKHVPLMELNAGEAIKNNVIGTQIVSDAADNFRATNFVMISTDKAVNPTSIMGSSKRIAEMYIQDLSTTSKTQFVTVRFGNVLDSEGSVVRIFKKQIEQGGPVTVTHPEMERYFMTIPEASQLILQAATMGKGGEIFVLNMGKPVKIIDLAKTLIKLSGFIPNEDIEITITKPRPGEKLFEELRIEGEDMQRTRHPKISIWNNIPMDRERLRNGISELINIAKEQNYEQIVQKIKELIPEYIDQTTTSMEFVNS
ncbi:MAG: polysaccharide biosynthesis protein [Sedimentisphaerales bacterium]|nr:polysaccharide biosynthesis protein [Sedimentisphaerales bacterium]